MESSLRGHRHSRESGNLLGKGKGHGGPGFRYSRPRDDVGVKYSRPRDDKRSVIPAEAGISWGKEKAMEVPGSAIRGPGMTSE